MHSINVLIFCYKQEYVIGRAIESALLQKGYGLNKIIIQDDSSPDNTWNIIQKYSDKYPDIICPYRNSQNLGIYGNFEALIKNRGDADLYTVLAGDDEIGINWFKAIQDSIKTKSLDVRNIAVTFLSDFKVVKPSGIGYINRNNKFAKDKNSISLKIRGIISARSTISSKKVYEQYQPLILNEGLGLAEAIADVRPFMYSESLIYVPGVGSVYYSGVGVSKELGGVEYYKERIHYYNRAKQIFPINKKTHKWLDFLIKRREFEMAPSLKKYFSLFIPYTLAFDKYNIYTIKSHSYMFYRLFLKLFRKKETLLRER